MEIIYRNRDGLMNKQFIEYLLESQDPSSKILIDGYTEVFNEGILDDLRGAYRGFKELHGKKDDSIIKSIKNDFRFYIYSLDKTQKKLYTDEFFYSSNKWLVDVMHSIDINKELLYYTNTEIYNNLISKLRFIILECKRILSSYDLSNNIIKSSDFEELERKASNFSKYQREKRSEFIADVNVADEFYTKENLQELGIAQLV